MGWYFNLLLATVTCTNQLFIRFGGREVTSRVGHGHYVRKRPPGAMSSFPLQPIFFLGKKHVLGWCICTVETSQKLAAIICRDPKKQSMKRPRLALRWFPWVNHTNLNVCKLCISCRASDKWTPASLAKLSLGLSATKTSTKIYRVKIADVHCAGLGGFTKNPDIGGYDSQLNFAVHSMPSNFAVFVAL